MEESIQKYYEMGMNDFILRSLDDIKVLYGVVPEDTEGYDQLPSEKQEIYREFLLKFFNSWGLDARLNLKPIDLKEDGEYMRFHFSYYDMDDYLTIVSRMAWR